MLGPVAGGLVLTALPEVLRALARVGGLPEPIAQFLVDGRLIVYGVLLALGCVFFPRGLVTPELVYRRVAARARRQAAELEATAS